MTASAGLFLVVLCLQVLAGGIDEQDQWRAVTHIDDMRRATIFSKRDGKDPKRILLQSHLQARGDVSMHFPLLGVGLQREQQAADSAGNPGIVLAQNDDVAFGYTSAIQ